MIITAAFVATLGLVILSMEMSRSIADKMAPFAVTVIIPLASVSTKVLQVSRPISDDVLRLPLGRGIYL